jgi:hypothetical protein
MVPLDCHVAVLLAMTGWGVVGRIVSSQFRDSSTLRCHCEPVRAWQSSRGRYVGCRNDARVADRFGWIAASGLCPSS